MLTQSTRRPARRAGVGPRRLLRAGLGGRLRFGSTNLKTANEGWVDVEC